MRNLPGKFPNIWKLNNILLNKSLVKVEVMRKIGKYFKLNENGYIYLFDLSIPEFERDIVSVASREINSFKCLCLHYIKKSLKSMI